MESRGGAAMYLIAAVVISCTMLLQLVNMHSGTLKRCCTPAVVAYAQLSQSQGQRDEDSGAQLELRAVTSGVLVGI